MKKLLLGLILVSFLFSQQAWRKMYKNQKIRSEADSTEYINVVEFKKLLVDTISNDSIIYFGPQIAKFDNVNGIYFDTTLSGDSMWIHPLGFYKDGQISMGIITMRDSVGGGMDYVRLDMFAFFPPYFWHNFENDATDFWCLKLKGRIMKTDSTILAVGDRPLWLWGHFDRSTHTFEQSAEVYLHFLDVAENIRMSGVHPSAVPNIYASDGEDLNLRAGFQLSDTLFIQTDTTITYVHGDLIADKITTDSAIVAWGSIDTVFSDMYFKQSDLKMHFTPSDASSYGDTIKFWSVYKHGFIGEEDSKGWINLYCEGGQGDYSGWWKVDGGNYYNNSGYKQGNLWLTSPRMLISAAGEWLNNTMDVSGYIDIIAGVNDTGWVRVQNGKVLLGTEDVFLVAVGSSGGGEPYNFNTDKAIFVKPLSVPRINTDTVTVKGNADQDTIWWYRDSPQWRMYSNDSSGMVFGITTNVIEIGKYSAIVGGRNDTIKANAEYCFIGGGWTNEITSGRDGSAIVGGIGNTISHDQCFIGGGSSNNISGGGYSAIVGGSSNECSGQYSFIAGKSSKIIGSGSYVVAIVGGSENLITNAKGGSENCLSGGGRFNYISDAKSSAIVGGYYDSLYSSQNSFIGGGYYNVIRGETGDSNNVAFGDHSVVKNCHSSFAMNCQIENADSTFGFTKQMWIIDGDTTKVTGNVVSTGKIIADTLWGELDTTGNNITTYVGNHGGTTDTFYVKHGSSWEPEGWIGTGDTVTLDTTTYATWSDIGDSSNVVRGEIRDTIDVARSWSDIADTCDAHDTQLLRTAIIESLNVAEVGITEDWYFGDTIWSCYGADSFPAIYVDGGKLHFGDIGLTEIDSAQLGSGATLKKWVQVGSFMAFIENDNDTMYAIPDTTQLGGGGIASSDKMTADSALTTSTLTDSPLFFSVTAGIYYHFQFNLIYQTSNTGCGLMVSVTIPAVTTFAAEAVIGGHGGDGVNCGWRGNIGSSGDAVTSTTTTVSGADLIATVRGTILPSENGTLMLQFATENGTDTITLRQGSCGFLYTLP